MSSDREMAKALEADGEKLRALSWRRSDRRWMIIAMIIAALAFVLTGSVWALAYALCFGHNWARRFPKEDGNLHRSAGRVVRERLQPRQVAT